jgi:FtsH-binding integral membrane protein
LISLNDKLRGSFESAAFAPMGDSALGAASMAMTTASQASAPPGAAHVFLRGVYAYMALGLSVTGIVAYLDERSGLYAALEKTPAFLVSALVAPLALVLLLSYRIKK